MTLIRDLTPMTCESIIYAVLQKLARAKIETNFNLTHETFCQIILHFIGITLQHFFGSKCHLQVFIKVRCQKYSGCSKTSIFKIDPFYFIFILYLRVWTIFIFWQTRIMCRYILFQVVFYLVFVLLQYSQLYLSRIL